MHIDDVPAPYTQPYHSHCNVLLQAFGVISCLESTDKYYGTNEVKFKNLTVFK
jgi:hypothetical protein